jgi:hypothetical protein
MSEFDDADVLDRDVCDAEIDPIDNAIDSALRAGFLDMSSVENSGRVAWDDLAKPISAFGAQCRFFAHAGGNHPCVRFADEFIPIDILSGVASDPTRPVNAGVIWRATQERVDELRADGLDTRMVPVEQAKNTFRRALKRFILTRIDAIFGSDPPTESRGDDFRGLRVTVSARTSNRLVVISNSFFCRTEQPFGDGLTSPVVGYLPSAGCYYFGLLDGTNDRAHWSHLMYEIPPNLNVALHI